MRLVFGPVHSRRLGRSLGINNVPLKYCTYSCVYCQAGRTTRLTIERASFYSWTDIVSQVINALRALGENNIDVVTFVPNGEPTLDIDIGREIREIKRAANIPVAVLSNGSLLFRDDVRSDLMEADIVSVKVDSVREETYIKINRPHPELKLGIVLEGIREFSREYRGRLLSETMLIASINDKEDEIEQIARFLREINIDHAYIAIPVRPTCETWVRPATEETLVRAYNIFAKNLGQERVKLLIELEKESPLGPIKDPVSELLSMLCVHPLKLDYAVKFLERAGLDPESTLRDLESKGLIRIVEYEGKLFLVRRTST